MSGSLAPQIQADAARVATTRADYFRALDNEVLNALATDLATAPDLTAKLAHIAAAAERLGAA